MHLTTVKHFFNMTIFFPKSSVFCSFHLFLGDAFSSNSKSTPPSKITKCDAITLISGDKRSINVIIKNSV